MELPVLINNYYFIIKDTKEIVERLQWDDEYLIQYIVRLVRSGETDLPVSPHDVDGFLNIERLQDTNGVNNEFRKSSLSTNNNEEEGTSGLLCPGTSTSLTSGNIECYGNQPSTSEQVAVNVWAGKGKPSIHDNAATQYLLELRSSDTYMRKFNDKTTVKLSLWKEISQKLLLKGYEVDAEKCRQKFLNLSKKYIEFKRHCTKTGNDKKNTPPYYVELHKILGNKDKVLLNNISDSLSEMVESTEATTTTTVLRNNNQASENINSNENEEAAPAIQRPKPQDKGKKVKMITKADVMKRIADCNEKLLNAQKENMREVFSAINVQNALIREQMEQNRVQRDRLISVLENIGRKKTHRKRKHESSSDSD